MRSMLTTVVLLVISFTSSAEGQYTNEEPEPVKYGVSVEFKDDVDLTSAQYKAISLCVNKFYSNIEKQLNGGGLINDIWSASVHSAYEDGDKWKVRTSNSSISYVATANFDEKYQRKGKYVRTITPESKKLWLSCTL